MKGAGLHRLVIPEDRVGPDPSLPVVDDRALVVSPKEDHRTVELEQLLLPEPFDLAVARAVRVADHAPQVALGRKNLRHCARRLPRDQRLRSCTTQLSRSPRARSSSSCPAGYVRASFGRLAART